MACFFGGIWNTQGPPVLAQVLAKGRRPLGTQLAAIGLAKRCNDVSARCVRPEK